MAEVTTLGLGKTMEKKLHSAPMAERQELYGSMEIAECSHENQSDEGGHIR